MMLNDFIHEREVRPVCVWYECEFCHKGEQKYDEASYTGTGLFPHKCDKCGKTMLLPRMFPFIKWIPGDPIKEIKDETT